MRNIVFATLVWTAGGLQLKSLQVDYQPLSNGEPPLPDVAINCEETKLLHPRLPPGLRGGGDQCFFIVAYLCEACICVSLSMGIWCIVLPLRLFPVKATAFLLVVGFCILKILFNIPVNSDDSIQQFGQQRRL